MLSKSKLKLARKVCELSRRWYGQKIFNPHCLQKKVGIVGVPFGKGQKQKGKVEAGLKAAPILLRKTGFKQSLECLGLDVCDIGDVEYEPDEDLTMYNMRNLDHVAPCSKAVAQTVHSVLDEGRQCLVIGGDHSVSIGSIYAHMKIAGPANVALVYVDAHPDINTNITSPSGNIHGMTVAIVADDMDEEWGEVDIPGMEWICSKLPLSNLGYIGLRSVDSGEAKIIKSKNITAFSMSEIDRVGLCKALSRSLSKIDPGCCKSIHLSFDIDALDYFEAPGTTVPVRGGLTLREGIQIAEIIHKTGRLAVVDLVEVNPAIGTEEQKQITLEAARNLLIAFFGHQRGGNVPQETKTC